MPGHIEAILFDMGGTLRRSTKRAFSEKVQICQQILALIGLDADPADFTRLLTTRANAYQNWSRQELIELNEVELWTQWMLPDFPVEQIRAVAVQLNQIWRDADRTWEILPHARETVLALYRRGYRLGLVSNTTSSVEVPSLLEQWGLAGYFDTVILSCQVGKRKPGPDILLEAAGRMQVQPGRSAYIGNLPERDVAAARNAGFSLTIILRDPHRPIGIPLEPSLLPDHFIDDLKNLLEIFPSRQSHRKPASHRRLYDASLSTMWGMKKFSAFGDFLLAAPRLGFAGVELNHQVTPGMLAEIDLNCCRFTSIHEPCPAVISAHVLKKQDLLISSPDEERRREGVNSIKRSIDLARQLGSQAVVVHCGQIQADWTVERELCSLFDKGQVGSPEYLELKSRYEAQRAVLVDPYLVAVRKSLLELLDYAAPLGVRIGIENRFHYSDIPTQDEMEGILAMASPDQLGFIYDVGHAQTQDRLGFYPHEGWLLRYANRMIGVHLHDVVGIHDHRAPGLGEVDFRMVAAYLPGNAFRTIEVLSSNTPEQITAGMRILVDTGCVTLND
jgi:FMN phosphatase YigB (HAD superfamily)/sugar phosphate isomerase/epimerase